MLKKPLIGILETGSGNIISLENSLKRIDLNSIRISNKAQFKLIDKLVIPGQGRFGSVLNHLNKSDLKDELQNWTIKNKPLLGICIGLQILFSESEEDIGIKGLSFFEGKIVKLESPKQPMMGWSNIYYNNNQVEQVYFVNSFASPEIKFTISTFVNGKKYSAILNKGNITACQFHPEKSGTIGLRLLKQWLY